VALLAGLLVTANRVEASSSPVAKRDLSQDRLVTEQEVVRTLVTGRLVSIDGTPVPNAVVVTAHGGDGLSDADGAFSFEVEVPRIETSLGVTAVASSNAGNLQGSALVRADPRESSDSRSADVGLITMSAATAGQACEELGWIPTFGDSLQRSGTVSAFAVFDDGSGSGPALYAGGDFRIAGGQSTRFVARWDGSSWSPLGSGFAAPVLALTVFDDGTGPALYAGGRFSGRIARWDGSSWSTLGSGMNQTVRALAVFDDGSGPALYAGGDFTTAGGQSANRIARWDGRSWSSLGSGMNDNVFALAVFDDGSGSGPALYAGGGFTTAGGQSANRIARWNASSWSPLGSGLDNRVLALAVFDSGSGSGPALYAGGSFTTAGGESASRIARWDGISWSPLGSGMDSSVQALTNFDDGSGSGPALYAGGLFTTAGGQSANNIARWDGSSWSPLGSGLDNGVLAVTVFDDGSGSGQALYAGGEFQAGGNLDRLWGVARWTSTAWFALAGDMERVPSVRALCVFDDQTGHGPQLYVGGRFQSAGGLSVNRIARWDGSSWSALGGGMDSAVQVLTVFDDGSGSGPALYAGGIFTTAGGQSAKHIARWDGRSWSPLGSGLNNTVEAIAVFDDGSGSGPALYAGGRFTTAGGESANRIARWDGNSWSPLDSEMDGTVFGLAAFDDGSGPSLYVGGLFTTAGGQTVNGIARWDGSSWSPLGSGTNGGVAQSFAVFDDGSGGGPALYVGGFLAIVDGQPPTGIARWDGSSWLPLGSGVNSSVNSLAVFDDGSGPALYAGGFFLTAGGQPANRMARWDGSSWSPLGSGMDTGVRSLAVFDDGAGSGPSLYVGGDFSTSTGGDSALAKWGCSSAITADVDGNGTVDFVDLLAVIAAWGACEVVCPEDVDGDGDVDFGDVLAVLVAWS
jgi:hypothetical protein